MRDACATSYKCIELKAANKTKRRLLSESPFLKPVVVVVDVVVIVSVDLSFVVVVIISVGFVVVVVVTGGVAGVALALVFIVTSFWCCRCCHCWCCYWWSVTGGGVIGGSVAVAVYDNDDGCY